MQRSARATALALGIEAVGDRERLGVELDDLVQCRTTIDRLDPSGVFTDQRSRRLLPGLHALL